MSEKREYFTRMGDGSPTYMTAEDIRRDIEEGVADAVKRAKIEALTDEEKERLFAIVIMEGNTAGVSRGMEVVSTSDSGCFKLNYQAHIPLDRSTAALINERVLGLDSVDIGNIDYSFKTVKPILHDEAKVMEQAQSQAVIPVLYGGMPDLGRYTKPDGPVDNWSELLPQGKIREAMAAQEEAVEYAVKDMVYIAKGMVKAGADGINLDTSGASGDADFLAALKAIEEIRKAYPDFGIEIGMAGEFVMGMHGKLKYAGERLAGMSPHQQVKVAEKAGANIFGPVVNTNSNKSFAWNLARAVTMIKACCLAAEIPVHVNVGMGVGGTPMAYVPPSDVVSKAAKAMVEIGRVDGL